jgi:hypothetical protein
MADVAPFEKRFNPLVFFPLIDSSAFFFLQSKPLQPPGKATKLARDLKKDLGHLRNRGVDPATFLSGALVRIAARVEHALRS